MAAQQAGREVIYCPGRKRRESVRGRATQEAEEEEADN